jgi:thiosulfate/3-mercaptopyruvate sulfurtransferase
MRLADEQSKSSLIRIPVFKEKAMKITAILCLLILLFIPMDSRQQVSCAVTPDEAAPMTVTVDWLEKHINDPNLVILHIGVKEEYDAGHIPGAAFIAPEDLAASREESDLSLQLPTAEKLKVALEKYGISNNSRIILYFGKDWVSPTTRVYFTLDVFGLGNNTSILDGGMPAWTGAGKILAKDLPARKPGILKVSANNNLVAQADWVRSNLNKDNVKIIDSRNTQFYTGAAAGNQPRAGHIPGAKNIPYDTLADGANKFKDTTTMAKMFADAGVKPGDTVVTYCHIGQQGTVDYFAAKSLGYKVMLYDGSFQEWSKLLDLPVDNPTGASAPPSVSVVTPQWVEEHRGDANVRILDVRQNVYDYFAGHVPGSVHLADSAMRFPAEGYPTQYPETFMVAQLVARAGVKKTDKVVIYSDGDGVLGATMVAYLLERIGHSDIAFVDGGWKDYKATQKTAQEYPTYKPARYDNLDYFMVRASFDDVKKSTGKEGVKVIDARAPDVFRGEVKIWTRNGHIPGAINVPWKTLMDETNTHKLKAIADMRKVYADKGIKETDDIIVYCGTSREASLEYMILKHILKFQKVRLYEGSWAEYSNHPEAEVETGAGK